MGNAIQLTLEPDAVVRVTSNHGGYYGGECIACGAQGWLDPRHGYPFGAKLAKQQGNRIQHKQNCQMNQFLNEDGSLRD